MSKVSRALDVLYMQGEDAGKSNYGSAVHQITAVKEAEQAINTYIEQVLKEVIGSDMVQAKWTFKAGDSYVADTVRIAHQNKLLKRQRLRASKLGFKIKGE